MSSKTDPLIRPLADDLSGGRPVAVVTGSAKRIGRQIAVDLARSHSVDVVVHYGNSHDAAADTAAEIRSAGRQCVTVSADLNDPEAAADSVFRAASELGTVTVLISCASVFGEQSPDRMSAEGCSRFFRINTVAPLFLAEQLRRQLPDSAAGHIINLLDWRAMRPDGSHAVYTASKAALLSLTQSLALQLAPQIQVNGIAPGAVLPPQDQPTWHSERAATAIPLRRAGTPTDISDAVGYLLQSDFVTGQILRVDGGEGL